MATDLTKQVIMLRSVYSKTGIKILTQPCKDNMGRYPSCVKEVDSNGDMIIADKDKGKIFIPANKVFTLVDGTTFDLSDPYQAACWEAVKNCPFIAESRTAKNSEGVSIIDGDTKRWGIAELYVYKPEEETERKLSRKKLITNACNYIFDLSKDDTINYARLLGKDMRNQPTSDVIDYLVQVAEKDPERIIELCTGSDTNLRLLLVEAKDRGIIRRNGVLYIYGDNEILGQTDEAVIQWMKTPKNKKMLQLIQDDTFPEYKKAE